MALEIAMPQPKID